MRPPLQIINLFSSYRIADCNDKIKQLSYSAIIEDAAMSGDNQQVKITLLLKANIHLLSVPATSNHIYKQPLPPQLATPTLQLHFLFFSSSTSNNATLLHSLTLPPLILKISSYSDALFEASHHRSCDSSLLRGKVRLIIYPALI